MPTSPTLDLVNAAKLGDGPAEKGGVSPAVLRAEVMLDRLHDSPGVIDGKDGANFVHALETFEGQRQLKPAKALDEQNWAALLRESGGPVLTTTVLSADDVKGPFFPDLPKDYGELAKLPVLGYRSPSQKIGAKFHMSEDLLAALNPGLDVGWPAPASSSPTCRRPGDRARKCAASSSTRPRARCSASMRATR